MTQTPKHYTLYRLDDGKIAGCSINTLPLKVIKIMNVRLEESDQKECDICDKEDYYL
jgi:hypothetical protein